MGRRLDIELTSVREDGSFTWRAAGAKQPKGEGSVPLPPGARAGEVLRAEATYGVDGIVIDEVQAPRSDTRSDDNTIEFLGPQREFKPVVGDTGGGDRKERSRRPRGRDDAGERRGPRGRNGPERGDRGERTRAGRERAPKAPPVRRRPKPKRLSPGRVHRDATLAALPAEHRPIAEQLIAGGLPAVRTALRRQNDEAKAAGGDPVPEERVLSLAEDMVAIIRQAEWLDRAEAAVADIDELSLRDLRSVVAAASDVAKEGAARQLATVLEEGLERRIARAATEWREDLGEAIEAGRVVRALNLSGRSPERGVKVPEELRAPLTELACAALAADTSPDRWIMIMDALAHSPVGRDVTPASVPDEPAPELVAKGQQLAGRLPMVVKALGIEPTPSGKPRSTAPSRAAQPRLPDGSIPPPPGWTGPVRSPHRPDRPSPTPD